MDQYGQIIYASIAKFPDIVLCEFSAAKGNFPQITRNLIRSQKIQENKCSITYNENWVFHIQRNKELLFLCLVETKVPPGFAFIFLKQLATTFTTKYSSQEILEAITYKMQDQFQWEMNQLIQKHNVELKDSKMVKAQVQLEDIKNIMTLNIEQVIERGEHVDLLVQKTQVLSDQAKAFNTSSKQLGHKYRNQRVKFYFIIISASIVVGYLLLSSFCGLSLSKC